MKDFKCKYCSKESVTIYGEELLCGKHYKQLYSEKLSEVQLDKVSKVKEEEELNKAYTKMLNDFNFYNDSKRNKARFETMVKRFKRDTKSVTTQNPLYFNIDKF